MHCTVNEIRKDLLSEIEGNYPLSLSLTGFKNRKPVIGELYVKLYEKNWNVKQSSSQQRRVIKDEYVATILNLHLDN